MGRIEDDECRRLLEHARVARLATSDRAGQPHLVPVVFVVQGNDIVFVVDAKPKRTAALKRLRNIAENPAVSLLVDHYDEDWSRLWWVRADGTATIEEPTPHHLELLAEKYPQQTPVGPAVRIRILGLTGWRP